MDFYFIDQATMPGQPSSTWVDFIKSIYPLLTFLLGLFIPRIWDYYKEKRRVANAGKDLNAEIELLGKPVEDQVGFIDEFIGQLKAPRLMPPIMTVLANLKMERIKDIKRVDIITYYDRLLGNRTEAVRKANVILASSDIMTHWVTTIERLAEEYRSRCDHYFREWNSTLDKMVRLIASYHTQLEQAGNELASDPFVSELVGLTAATLRNPENRDIFEVKEKYHEPLIHILIMYRHDPRKEELSLLNYQCIQAIREIESSRKEMAVKFENIKEGIKLQHGKLKAEMNNTKK